LDQRSETDKINHVEVCGIAAKAKRSAQGREVGTLVSRRSSTPDIVALGFGKRVWRVIRHSMWCIAVQCSALTCDEVIVVLDVFAWLGPHVLERHRLRVPSTGACHPHGPLILSVALVENAHAALAWEEVSRSAMGQPVVKAWGGHDGWRYQEGSLLLSKRGPPRGSAYRTCHGAKSKAAFHGLAMEPRGETRCTRLVANLPRRALQTQNEAIIWAGSYIASILWRQSAQAVERVSSCCGGEARQSVRFGRCQ